MSEQYLIGVDGGKTKTVCLLADRNGQVLGAGRAGSSDKYDVPLAQALDAISACVREAARQAGASLPVSAGCFGLAGADWPEDFEQLEKGIAAQNLAEQIVIKNDMHIALHANVDHGVVVSVGTHTASAIRTPVGEEWHAGWFAVEGPGGVSAGHRVLWAIFKAEDGRGDPTCLRELVLRATGKSDPRELLRMLSRGEIDDAFLASLTPLLFEAHYQHADPVASDIIAELGGEVAEWVIGLLSRFDLLQADIPVVFSGGLFKGSGDLLRESAAAAVHRRAPRARLQSARREPVIGALVYAYERMGITVEPALIEKIESSGPDASFFSTA